MLISETGLTSTYNRFHDHTDASPEVLKLRELRIEMDYAVASSYVCSDIDLEHNFHETSQGNRFTISEAARREVLHRLLILNHERYAEEVAQGLHDEKGKRGREKRTKSTMKKSKGQQLDLF